MKFRKPRVKSRIRQSISAIGLVIQRFQVQHHSRNCPEKIGIFIVAHKRSHFILSNLRQLTEGIEPSRYHVFILTDKYVKSSVLRELRGYRREKAISLSIIRSNRYLNKIRLMANSNFELVIKCDEDLFLGSNAWASLLKASRNLADNTLDVLSPILSTGIPSVEIYLELHPDKNFASKIRREFEITTFENWWDGLIEYESLNGKYQAKNPENFFKHVGLLTHTRKGIHPVRVNAGVQSAIAQNSIENRWWKNFPVGGQIRLGGDYPYLCNSLYMTKTSYLKKMLENVDSGAIENDGYDELALNQQMDLDSRKIGFAMNAIGIHPSYNTVGDSYIRIANKFFEEIMNSN